MLEKYSTVSCCTAREAQGQDGPGDDDVYHLDYEPLRPLPKFGELVYTGSASGGIHKAVAVGSWTPYFGPAPQPTPLNQKMVSVAATMMGSLSFQIP